MKAKRRVIVFISFLSLTLGCVSTLYASNGVGTSKTPCWRVDDIRAGMKGVGKTVIKGTKIQEFDVTILGVLKNTNPGRDMILARLSGCNLEKTGVIAGMSGSPVYIRGKLVGAVAYAWQFGTEPIAGITPFCQMRSFSKVMDGVDHSGNVVHSVGLDSPLQFQGKKLDAVKVSNSFASLPTANDGMFLTPLKTPLAATGFTANSLAILQDKLSAHGMVPMQGGGVSGQLAKRFMNTQLEPGGALTVALITGDFDLSGIGTVTHVEGKRVYGWGHPFMSLGGCDIPMMTGYVHLIYPRQNLSFKMGSPLKTVGTINADVSTCIAGWLDREPDMLPVKMTVAIDSPKKARTFNVNVVRQHKLMPTLVFTALTNSVDMEGELPKNITTDFRAKIYLKGHKPLIIEDSYSGSTYSGSRAARVIYNEVAELLSRLLNNSHEDVRVEKIECFTLIRKQRRTATIEAVELDSDRYRPGETVKATVILKPHKQTEQRTQVSLKLPTDLVDGDYHLLICTGSEHANANYRDNPIWNDSQNLEQSLQGLQVRYSAKRSDLVLRIPLSDLGVSVKGQALPNLPPSMVQLFTDSRRSTETRSINGAISSTLPTDWVLSGSKSITVRVSRKNRLDH